LKSLRLLLKIYRKQYFCVIVQFQKYFSRPNYGKDILHFKMIDCNDILVYRIIDVWYWNTILFSNGHFSKYRTAS
jgi:hypothetical protein